MNSKRRPLNGSYSTNLLAVTQGPGGFSNAASTAKLAFPQGNTTSSNRSMVDSFYSNRRSSIGIGEPKKKRNLGVTLSKLELPARLVQQKELFNEMGGWLTQQNKQKEVTEFQQSTRKSFNNRQLSTQSNYYQPNHSHTSSFLNFEANASDKKKPNFYDHKNIFRVKDFRQLKNSQDKIAKSIDDPISIAQRRLLIQEFEMKVQQFLKILKIKKELGAKSYEKFYKNVELSMGGLNTFNISLHNRAHSSQSINQFQNSQNTFINNQSPIPYQTTQETQNSNSFLQQNNNNMTTQNGQYPTHIDSVISQNGQVKRNQQLQSLQNQSIHQVNNGEMNDSSNTSDNYNANSMNNNSGQKQTSFIDKTKDIEWQYNTYYQINQHQFQELSEKQINILSKEEKEQYFLILNHFKQVGHRFQVQVVVQNAKQGGFDSSQNEIQQGNLLPTINSKSKRQLTQASHSNSRIALHQRLQDYILERCRNYLNSDNTDYDEKLANMKQQYELMLDNFEKKSHKVWLPPNMKARNQDFNDFYVYEDPEDLQKLLKQTFEELTEENFGSVLSINMNIVNQSLNKTQDKSEILIEDDIPVQAEESEEEQVEQEYEEESSYVETPYSQKKARNKKKFQNAASKYNQKQEEPEEPPQQKPPKQKKKKPPQITQVQDGPASQKNTPHSTRSDQSDDSDMNFTKSYNQRFKSGSIKSNDNSPQLRQKPSSQFNKKVKTPQSNRSSQALDSENEDKVEDNKESARSQKKIQGRSQFSKKAQPPSGNISRRTIEAISDQNTDNSGIVNPEKQEYEEKDPITPKSIEELSLTPTQKTKKKIRTQKSDDSGGFEQAKDELEDLNGNNNNKNNQTNQNNRDGFNNLDNSFDLNDLEKQPSTSRKKVGDQNSNSNNNNNNNNTSNNNIPGSKRDISTKKTGTTTGTNKQIPTSSQKLSKERSSSNISSKSNQSISGQSQSRVQNQGSTFKQKIQHEIMMEEESNRKEEDEEMETVILGTGLFDRILATNNYLDFDVITYLKPKNKSPVNPNIPFKDEQDRSLFEKICQWEQEVSEENENYSKTQDTIVDSLLKVQFDINENKKKKSKGVSLKNMTKSKIKKGNTSSLNEYSDTSIRKQDSIIENSQLDLNNSSHQQETSFFNNNTNYIRNQQPSITSQINRQGSDSQSSLNLAPSDKNIQLNKSLNDQSSPISAQGRSLNLNLSKLSEKQGGSPTPSVQNKKQFKTNPTEPDEQLGIHSISSNSGESRDSDNSLINLENIKLPQQKSSSSGSSEIVNSKE